MPASTARARVRYLVLGKYPRRWRCFASLAAPSIARLSMERLCPLRVECSAMQQLCA